MEKKGLTQIKAQSHIETILSFVIFAGFIFALLFFLNPISQKSTSTAVLDLAQQQIIDNLSISYEKISLILDSPVSGNCFFINNSIGAGNIVLVQDSQGQIKNSSVLGNPSKIYISPTALERYYVLYYDFNFNSNNLSSTSGCSEAASYSFGLHDKDKLVLYENLIAFNETYHNNYDLLKNNLNIKSEFVFSVFNETNSLIMSGDRARPAALNLLSRNIPLLAADKNMNRTDIILNLRVWE